MHYTGPGQDDLANVSALNLAFLELLVSDRAVLEPVRRSLPDAAERLARLTPRERQRLARSPFLLMSFREHDPASWRALFEPLRDTDLFDGLCMSRRQASQLIDAGLAFLWQLARRNTYAARVVSGASLGWCEQLAELTLVELLARAQRDNDLLSLREATNRGFWQKLLVSGTSREPATRQSARICALQMLLTRARSAGRLKAAAARLDLPQRRLDSGSGRGRRQ